MSLLDRLRWLFWPASNRELDEELLSIQQQSKPDAPQDGISDRKSVRPVEPEV